jgi:hypothetical protein
MTNAHPRLRSHVRKGKNGNVRTYWFYDMRHEGKPDIPLGRDYAKALEKWEEIHLRKPRIAGTLLEAFEGWEREVLPNYENAGTKRTYAQSLTKLKPVFGPCSWEAIELSDLKGYLKGRTAKTQGNREMALLSVIWNWARGEGLTNLPWPAAGMEKSRWKNKESARRFEVSDALFAAVYSQADRVLRDCMDLATATGMRLTDCRMTTMPSSGVLRLNASKTSKQADFDVASSPVLTRLLEARRLVKADHLMLLTTPTGKPVSATMLRARWDEAREKAAKAHPELAAQIEAMYLRDMRKRAADLASDLEEASRLLQHSSTKVTADHYRNKPVKVRPVR